MRKTLPILPPMLTSYVYHGIETSIMANNLVMNGWIYNHYLQLECKGQDGGKMRLDFTDKGFFENEGILQSGYFVFPFDSKSEKNYLMKEFKELIDRKYYIKVWMIMENGHRKEHLIYGYNDFERCFYVEGRQGTWDWNNERILYKECQKRVIPDLYHDPAGCLGVHVYQRISDSRSIQVDQIASKIEEGLMCGKHANYQFYEDTIFRMSHGLKVHLPSFVANYEHKKVMLERMNYLYQTKGIVAPMKEWSKIYQNAYQMVQSVCGYNRHQVESAIQCLQRNMDFELEHEENILKNGLEAFVS